MIAVIGAGRWGVNYLRTLLQLKEEVNWLYSRSGESLKRAAKEANAENIKTTTDYSKILSDKSVKAVAIAVAASAHYEMARKALEAGKHVLVEKPMTLNAAEAETLVKIADERKVTLMAGHIHRYNPGIQKLKEEISLKSFGNLEEIRITTTSSGPVREDTNALWDMAPHDITIARYLLGTYPDSVSAKGTAKIKNGKEDEVGMSMKFGNIIVETRSSWASGKKQRLVKAKGSKAAAIYDDCGKKLTVEEGGKERDIGFDKTPPLAIELKHFIECVETGKQPLTGGREGLETVRVLEKAQESIRKKGIEFSASAATKSGA